MILTDITLGLAGGGERMKSETWRRKQISTNKNIHIFLKFPTKINVAKKKKKQKPSESLVEMLVFYETGQGSHGHTLLPWLGKQNRSRTSITAQGGPTQRPREWSPFVRFKGVS